MVRDRVTDGTRIAQLLASELTGRSSEPLDRVTISNAVPDAEPSAEGTFAYEIRDGDGHLGDVLIQDAAARIVLSVDGVSPSGSTTTEAFTASDGFTAPDGVLVTDVDGDPHLTVEYGAAVKRVVDILISLIEE